MADDVEMNERGEESTLDLSSATVEEEAGEENVSDADEALNNDKCCWVACWDNWNGYYGPFYNIKNCKGYGKQYCYNHGYKYQHSKWGYC